MPSRRTIRRIRFKREQRVFALTTPLFLQVVIDMVLVHRGITTPPPHTHVLVLIVVSVFKTVLGALRTYVFAHTTNRTDVELGAGLYRHLVAPPLAYFEARRVGDSVARVCELENIRNFLARSALTLMINLIFTVVFLAAMFYYSPLLTWIVIGSLVKVCNCQLLALLLRVLTLAAPISWPPGAPPAGWWPPPVDF